jgi:hypothetical protein
MKAEEARRLSSYGCNLPSHSINHQIVIPSKARNLQSLVAAKMLANHSQQEIHSFSMFKRHIKPSKVGIG